MESLKKHWQYEKPKKKRCLKKKPALIKNLTKIKGPYKKPEKTNGHKIMKTREKVGHMKNLENKNYGSIKSLNENYGKKSLF